MRPLVLIAVVLSVALVASACGGSDEIALPADIDGICEAISMDEVKNSINGAKSAEEGATSRSSDGCAWWVDVGNDNVQVTANVVSQSFEEVVKESEERFDFVAMPTDVGDQAAFLLIGFGGDLVVRDGENVWDIEVSRIPEDYNDVAGSSVLPNEDAERLARYLIDRFADPA